MNIENLIGNTPMIKINYNFNNKLSTIYAKLEYYNFTGSIKDRMAYYILSNAIKNGELKPNQPIIEATSGNTGISLSAISAILKHPVHIFMPDWMSIERRKIMEMYGATLHLVSKAEGGFSKAISETISLAKELNGFLPKQFDNKNNYLSHYYSTSIEILNKLNSVDSFVSGIGTGGTLMGISKRLKEFNSNIKTYALEPNTLSILSMGHTKGSHKIEGIGDDFIPSIVDKNLIDDVILVNDLDSINMSKLLAKKLGLGVGISSGANFLAAVLLNKTNNIVTVFADDNKKYVSTDLFGPINNNDEFISNKIKLINFEIV